MSTMRRPGCTWTGYQSVGPSASFPVEHLTQCISTVTRRRGVGQPTAIETAQALTTLPVPGFQCSLDEFHVNPSMVHNRVEC